MRFASGEEAASLLAADSGVIPDYGVGSGAHRGGTTGAAWVRRQLEGTDFHGSHPGHCSASF